MHPLCHHSFWEEDRPRLLEVSSEDNLTILEVLLEARPLEGYTSSPTEGFPSSPTEGCIISPLEEHSSHRATNSPNSL